MYELIVGIKKMLTIYENLVIVEDGAGLLVFNIMGEKSLGERSPVKKEEFLSKIAAAKVCGHSVEFVLNRQPTSEREFFDAFLCDDL